MRKKVQEMLIVIVIISLIFSFNVNADEIVIKDWIPNDDDSNERISDITGKILGVLQVCGTIISIIVVILIGIKYMCGSIEERAEYKKSMFPYIVGCILIFSTVNIASFIYDISNSFKPECKCNSELCIEYEGYKCHPDCQECSGECKY